MKVLLLNGSPNLDGCTYAALREISAVLRQEGIETETLQLGTKPVRSCIACNRCKEGRCVFDDDLANRVLEKMERCDGLVIGSPVYFASANGGLISLLDRVFYAGNCFRYKAGCVVVSARRAGTTAAYDQLNKYLGISGMVQAPSCYWNMVHGSEAADVARDAEGVRIMRTLGKNMAWLMKSLEAARGQVPLPDPEPPARTDFIR